MHATSGSMTGNLLGNNLPKAAAHSVSGLSVTSEASSFTHDQAYKWVKLHVHCFGERVSLFSAAAQGAQKTSDMLDDSYVLAMSK